MLKYVVKELYRSEEHFKHRNDWLRGNIPGKSERDSEFR